MDNRNGCRKVITCEVTDCTIVKKVCVGTPIRAVTSSTSLSFADLTNIKQTVISLTNTDAQQQIDGFLLTAGKVAEYLVQINVGDKYQALKILVLSFGSSAKMVEYAVVRSDDDLGDFCVENNGTSTLLKFSPTYENTSVTYTRILNE